MKRILLLLALAMGCSYNPTPTNERAPKPPFHSAVVEHAVDYWYGIEGYVVEPPPIEYYWGGCLEGMDPYWCIRGAYVFYEEPIILVATGSGTPEAIAPIICHELLHALQDQRGYPHGGDHEGPFYLAEDCGDLVDDDL